MAKRQWSRAFARQTGHGGLQLSVSGVPATLKQKFAARCRREGRSQRNLLLGWVRNWVAGRRPDEDGAASTGEGEDSSKAAGPAFPA